MTDLRMQKSEMIHQHIMHIAAMLLLDDKSGEYFNVKKTKAVA